MRMSFRATALLLVASIMLLSLGCSSNNKEENDGGKPAITTIRGFGWDPEEMENVIIEAFEKENPDIHIEYQFVDITQSDSVLNTQLASGEGPDYFYLGAGYRSLVRAGYVEPIDDAPFLTRYTDTGRQQFEADGHIYAVPGLSWYGGLYYNKELFEQYNVSVPRTFDEWMSVNETFKNAGIRPIVMGGNSWESFLHLSVGVLLNTFYRTEQAAGFDQDFSDGKRTLSGNWNEGLAVWERLVQEGFLAQDLLGMSYEQAEEEFVRGKAAVFAGGGNWSLGEIRAKNPDLSFGFFPYPSMDGKTGWLIGGPGAGYAINARSEHKEEVLRLMEFVSRPETQQLMYSAKPGSSSVKGVELPLDPVYQDSEGAMQAGNVYCPWCGWFDSEPIIIEYGKALQDYLVGAKTIDDVLAATDKKAAELRKIHQP